MILWRHLVRTGRVVVRLIGSFHRTRSSSLISASHERILWSSSSYLNNRDLNSCLDSSVCPSPGSNTQGRWTDCWAPGSQPRQATSTGTAQTYRAFSSAFVRLSTVLRGGYVLRPPHVRPVRLRLAQRAMRSEPKNPMLAWRDIV